MFVVSLVSENVLGKGGVFMRLMVTLESPGEIILPVHYNYLLQAAIYRQITRPVLREFLHEKGFALGQRRFKLFTFSRLMGRLRLDRAAGKIIFKPPFDLVVCSPIPFVLEEIGNGLLREGNMRLGDSLLEVRAVKVEDVVVRSSPILVRMLSPVVVYSTLETGGKRYTYYYSPFEPRFKELILTNLSKKYLLIFGRPGDGEGFDISPVRVRPSDLKIMEYKGTVIKGWMGTYRLAGDPQLLEVALDAGLGGKNSQGFGCCTVEGRCGGETPSGNSQGFGMFRVVSR